MAPPTSNKTVGQASEEQLPSSASNSMKEPQSIGLEKRTTDDTRTTTQEGTEKDAKIKTDYKTCNWWQCGVLMIAECISLGILSLPRAMAVLGLGRCLLLIVILGVVAGYTGYIIGQWKSAHSDCRGFADAGKTIGGERLGRIFGIGQIVVLLFISAAHINSFTIMMNVLTGHATCSIVWSVIGLALCFGCTLPRTLKSMSHLSCLSCLSILTAVFIVMIDVGIVKPHPNATVGFTSTSFKAAMNSVLNIVLAYSGHVTYFGFVDELRDSKDFKKSLLLLQTTAITMYTIAAVVIYCYVGPDVKAPALGSAPPLVAKIAYGIASLTIVIAGVINGHVASKAIYRWWWTWRKGSEKVGEKVVEEKSPRAWGSWALIVGVVWVIAWLIAEAIPIFEYLLAFVSALFSGWYSYGITSFLWLYLNKGKCFATKTQVLFTFVNAAIFCIGAIISIAGLIATGMSIADGDSGKPFSCEDNSRHL